MANRLKAFVAATVIVISGSAASSAEAQLLRPYGNPGPFLPSATGVYVAPYPYSWQWYPGFIAKYGSKWGYRPEAFAITADTSTLPVQPVPVPLCVAERLMVSWSLISITPRISLAFR